jgi:hypothetical protein
MRVLVVDVGGTHVKVLASGEKTSREFASGPTLTAAQMVAGVKTVALDWKYDAVSIGYPGPVLDGRPVVEPRNLGPGWVGFDYQTAFGCRVKVVNDAAMQALGAYKGGKMLFLGLEPAWARPSWSRASWSRWSWAICRTEMSRSSTTWDCAACRRTGSRNGGVTSRTSSRG